MTEVEKDYLIIVGEVGDTSNIYPVHGSQFDVESKLEEIRTDDFEYDYDNVKELVGCEKVTVIEIAREWTLGEKPKVDLTFNWKD